MEIRTALLMIRMNPDGMTLVTTVVMNTTMQRITMKNMKMLNITMKTTLILMIKIIRGSREIKLKNIAN